MKKSLWFLQNGGFFPIANFFLAKQRFWKYQLILWPDLKNSVFIWNEKKIWKYNNRYIVYTSFSVYETSGGRFNKSQQHSLKNSDWPCIYWKSFAWWHISYLVMVWFLEQPRVSLSYIQTCPILNIYRKVRNKRRPEL